MTYNNKNKNDITPTQKEGMLSNWRREIVKKCTSFDLNWISPKYRNLIGFIFLIIIFLVLAYLKTNNQPASVMNSPAINGNQNNISQVVGDNNLTMTGSYGDVFINRSHETGVLFDPQKWTDGFGTLWILNRDCNQISLPDDQKYGSKKYTDPLEDEINFYIEFKSKNNRSALNFSLSMYGIYYIVIGDSDKRSVVLRATKNDDPLDTKNVPESNSELDRTPLEFEPDLDKIIRINFNQKVINDQLLVHFDISYWDKNGEPRNNSFKYLFTPSGLMNYDKYLYIGLVGDTNSGGASIKMINPRFCIE